MHTSEKEALLLKAFLSVCQLSIQTHKRTDDRLTKPASQPM